MKERPDALDMAILSKLYRSVGESQPEIDIYDLAIELMCHPDHLLEWFKELEALELVGSAVDYSRVFITRKGRREVAIFNWKKKDQ